MSATCPRAVADETLGCISLRWSTDGEVDHSLRQGTRSLGQQYLGVRELFWMERLQTVPGFVNVL